MTSSAPQHAKRVLQKPLKGNNYSPRASFPSSYQLWDFPKHRLEECFIHEALHPFSLFIQNELASKCRGYVDNHLVMT